MKRDNKRRRTKRGTSSVFLAVIMSAIILVECTFVAYVWNLDYALSVNTALKSQIDTILSDYNRLLFDVYGIYAFSLDDVDDSCFNKALEINGLAPESELIVSGAAEFTTDDLKQAISSYYAYRGYGIAFKNVVEGYSEMILEIDNRGIFEKVGEYMHSPAAEYVSKIIQGSDSAEEWVKKAGDTLKIEELVEQIADIDSIRQDYRNATRDFELDLDFDVAEWDSFLGGIGSLEEAIDSVTDSSPEVMKKFFVSHYCAYNFDCCFRPDGDGTINGTSFDSIHSTHEADCEYIITGKDRYQSIILISYRIKYILIAANMLKDYADERFRNTMEVLGEIISMIISAVSEGTVNIDPKIIAFGLTFYCAAVQAVKDYWYLIHGDRAVIFEYEGTKIVTYSYRDFLYLFAFCTKEEDLLERSREILTRDFGDLYTGITLEADFRGSTYSLEKSYQLYE